jgi:myo-inositol-1-phosphate synthase
MTAATTASVNSSIKIDSCRISGCPSQFPSVHVESDQLVESSANSRVVRYTSSTTSVKRTADGSMRVIPSHQNYLLQVPTDRPKSVGLMMVGWGGNNGSTLTAALTAHQQGTTWKSRRGVEKPNFYGSLIMASSVTLGFEEGTGKELFAPMFQLAPFADPNELVIGGWDISALNIADSCDRAKVLEPTLIDQLSPNLSTMKPLPSIYDPTFIASNQSDRADNVIEGNKRTKLEQIRRDIRYAACV